VVVPGTVADLGFLAVSGAFGGAPNACLTCDFTLTRDCGRVECEAECEPDTALKNPEVAGSNPAPATNVSPGIPRG
jgi:hypothetical protein